MVLGNSEILISKVSMTDNDAVALLKKEKKLSHDLFSQWFPVKIGKKKNGAPDELDGYSLSNSHSHGWVAVARNNKNDVGMDLQVFSEKCQRVAQKFISELDASRPDSMEKIHYYTLFWCLKEAAYKFHEDFVALKDICIQAFNNGIAKISIQSSKGKFNCLGFYSFSDQWVISTVRLNSNA